MSSSIPRTSIPMATALTRGSKRRARSSAPLRIMAPAGGTPVASYAGTLAPTTAAETPTSTPLPSVARSNGDLTHADDEEQIIHGLGDESDHTSPQEYAEQETEDGTHHPERDRLHEDQHIYFLSC